MLTANRNTTVPASIGELSSRGPRIPLPPTPNQGLIHLGLTNPAGESRSGLDLGSAFKRGGGQDEPHIDTHGQTESKVERVWDWSKYLPRASHSYTISDLILMTPDS